MLEPFICLRACNMHAGGDPQLWAEALEFFCSQPGDCSSAISQVLQHIEQGELLPPLVVLQTLAKNKNLKVGFVHKSSASQDLAYCVHVGLVVCLPACMYSARQ